MRELSSILRRLAISLILAVGVWSRGQVANDGVYLDRSGGGRLDVANSMQGIRLRLQFFDSGSKSSSRWRIETESELKYRWLWRHVYLSQIKLFLIAARDGIRIRDYNYLGIYGDYQVAIPHFYLAVFIFALTAVEARIRRRRRYASGLCTNCGYDIRSNSDRCSECGATIETPQVIVRTLRRRRRIAHAFWISAIAILAFHAFAGVLRFYAGHLVQPIRIVDELIEPLIRFPAFFDGDASNYLSFAPCVLIAICAIINCLLWGWTLQWIARVFFWTFSVGWPAIFRLTTSKAHPHP